MRTIGEAPLSVTELLVEGALSELSLGGEMSSGFAVAGKGDVLSELTLGDGISSEFLSGDVLMLVLMRGCSGGFPACASELTSEDDTPSSNLIKECAGEKPIRSGAGGEAAACMPAVLQSTMVLFHGQSRTHKARSGALILKIIKLLRKCSSKC